MALRVAPAAPFDAGRLSPPLVSAESFAALARHVPRGMIPERLRTLAPSRELLRIDLHTARGRDPLPVARARFRVKSGRAVGGIAVWVDMGLAPGRRSSDPRRDHLDPDLSPHRPASPRARGVSQLELDWNAARRRWRVEFAGDRGARHTSDHSPLFAWGAVRPAMPRAISGSARRRRR